MEHPVRKAYVAGKFYPSTEAGIDEMFEKIRLREVEHIDYDLSHKQLIGAVLPHAGVMYSGYQTIHFFEIMAASSPPIDTCIIVHPFHRGGDVDFATDKNTAWRTPLGEVALDMEFIREMDIHKSDKLHQWEHSAEVLLPFIQKYTGRNIKIVPVGMGRQDPETSSKIADSVLKAQVATGRKILFLASSDFSHYLDPESGRKKDQLVLDHILSLDAGGIYTSVRRNDVSVCGYGPIMSLMYYALGRFPDVKVRVLSRGHSGEVYPSESVVDYISILFYRDV